jgi:colanic acid/amylovoran biosynthesis glycosyltransferase
VTPRPSALVVAWHFPLYSERFVVDHVEGLVDRGWQVTVACAEPDPVARRLRPTLAPIPVVALEGLAERTNLRRLRSLVAEGELRNVRSPTARHAALVAGPLRRVVADVQPDLVHAHYAPNGAAAALACGPGGPPVVADLHGFDLTDRPQDEGWGPVRRLLAGTSVVVHSAYAAGQVRGGAGLDALVVRYGTPDVFWAPARPQRWPVPLRLLVVARLVPEKGVELVVEADAALARTHPELDPQLTVVGDGPEDARLRSFVQVFGADERTTFRGVLDEAAVAAAMREHDVLVVPSRELEHGWRETFGRVATEGLASGMAVVAAATGGLPEALDGGGHLVPPDDTDALTAALVALLDTSTPAAELAATRAARAVHPLTETWSAYDALGRSLLAARRSERDGQAERGDR